MRKINFLGKIAGAMLLAAPLVSNAQIKTPAPSPAASITQSFGLTEVTVDYSRPGVKNRTVFGDLVPFGELWRFGANSSTKIEFADDVKINGKDVKKGMYALYAIPGKTEWEMVIHTNTTYGGTGDAAKHPEDDALRFKVPVMKSPMLIESFTIAFGNVKDNSADMMVMWENTMLSFTITQDIDTKIMASIEKTLNPTPAANDYNAAATFLHTNGKDLNQALTYVNKAIELNPKAFWMIHNKAKIQKDLKDYNGAVKTAELSKKVAIEEDYKPYIKMNDDLIADVKKMM